MRSEAMKSKMLYDRPLPTQRIVNAIADSKLISLYRNMQSRFFFNFLFDSTFYRGTSKHSTIWT